MNGIAFILGETQIGWSAVIITLGLVSALFLAVALFRGRKLSSAPVWLCFYLSFAFGALFSRILHWYFNDAIYNSLGQALMDCSFGGFCLPGMILGVLLGAWIVKLTGLVRSAGELKDCFAPGLVLSIAFIRLSALFNESCRGRIIVRTGLLQRLPFAVASTDAAGNVSYRLATFFIAFILLMILAVIVLIMYFKRSQDDCMKAPCGKSGNIWRMTLVYYSALEVISDSTRYDSQLMHFRLFSDLNQYSAFISLAQIFAGVCILAVLVYYSRASIKANGFRFYHPLCWLLFLAGLFLAGYLGEYKVQRVAAYLRSYCFMFAGCAALTASVQILYRSCLAKKNDGPKQEADDPDPIS